MDANVEIRNFWWFVKRGPIYLLFVLGQDGALNACTSKPYRKNDFIVLPDKEHPTAVFDVDEEKGTIQAICESKKVLIIGKQVLWEHWPNQWYLWRRDIKAVLPKPEISSLSFDQRYRTETFYLGTPLGDKKYHVFKRNVYKNGELDRKEIIRFVGDSKMDIIIIKECGIGENKCPYWIDIDGKVETAADI